MMNKNERMEILNGKGIDTSKNFNFNLPEGLKPGATISLVINENGEPVVINGNNDNYPKAINAMMAFKEDAIRNQIITDGYVKNTKLFRRFVMAQMFYMLNYVSYDGKYKGYNDYLKTRYDYKYTLNMMLDEVKVLSKLEVRDEESFLERSQFFSQNVVVAVLNDYLEKLKGYVEALPNKNCKGVPYKRVKGENIFVADLDKKLYRPIRDGIYYVAKANNYTQMYNALARFMKYDFIKLPYYTSKSKVWVDTYKGEGAYYTLKNLIMFHGCGIKTDKYNVEFGASAMLILKSKLQEYKGEGYRMFALMKKVISDNGFDFNKRMEEIYAQKK